MKWLFSLTKLVLAAVLVSIVSIYTTWFTVNLYVDDLLNRFHITTPSQRLQLSQWIAGISKQWGMQNSDPSLKDSPGGTAAPADGPERESAYGGEEEGRYETDMGTGAVAEGEGAGHDENTRSQAVREEDSLPAWNQSGGDFRREETGLGDQEIVITEEDFSEKKNRMSDEDKSKIFSILVSRLSPEEMQEISEIVEDGITEAELEQLQTIVTKYLKPEEYRELLDILQKY